MKIVQKFKHMILTFMVCIIPATGLADSFLETDKPFFLIEDEHNVAEAWGTCVAAYNLMSMIQEDTSPAFSKQMSDRSNGAKIALFIDYFLKLDSDSSSNQISSRKKMANVLMESIPEAQLTAMMAAGEQLQFSEEWFELLTSTIKLCASNLDQQQNLINTWRELYASGAFN